MEEMRAVPSDAKWMGCCRAAEQVHGQQDRRLALNLGEPAFRPHHDNSMPLMELLKLCASAA